MKSDISIDILRIAATLTNTALTTKAPTASQKNGATIKVEAVFSDCVKLVEKHYLELKGKE